MDHETGEGVPGAAVSLAAGPTGLTGRGTRLTDDEGRFRFPDVPPGTYRVRVSTLGYRLMSDTLQVPPDGDLNLILPLSPGPVELEPIVVEAEREFWNRRGYANRRRFGTGFVITREDIEERNPRLLSELLHRVPGGMVVPTPPAGYTLRLRGMCQPGVWMDGIRVPYVNSIDQFISAHDVEAVEVYHGTELPVEFGVDLCGGILIWTRQGRPPPGGGEPLLKRKLVGRLFMAGLVLATVLFIR